MIFNIFDKKYDLKNKLLIFNDLLKFTQFNGIIIYEKIIFS